MSDKVLFIYIFSGVWGLIGIIFFLIGFFMLKNRKKKEQVCTSKTIGKVIDICQQRSSNFDSYSYSTYFHPVFEYTVNNLIYRKQSTSGSTQSKFAINQEVDIYYDPANPHNFYTPQDTITKNISKIFTAAGIGCILIALISGITIYFVN